MSISLKVVSIAAVFWDSFNLWEIFCLILDIGTLISVLEPWISRGAFLAVVEDTGELLEAAGAFYCTGAALGASAFAGVAAGAALGAS